MGTIQDHLDQARHNLEFLQSFDREVFSDFRSEGSDLVDEIEKIVERRVGKINLSPFSNVWRR
jgi:hypothetical protein